MTHSIWWHGSIPKTNGTKPRSEVEPYLKGKRLFPTETVLIELLNYLAEFPPEMREAVTRFVKLALENKLVEVGPHTHEAFSDGFHFTETVLTKVTA